MRGSKVSSLLTITLKIPTITAVTKQVFIKNNGIVFSNFPI